MSESKFETSIPLGRGYLLSPVRNTTNTRTCNQIGKQTEENEGLTRHGAEEAPWTNMWCEDVRHAAVEHSACWLAHTAGPLEVHNTIDPIVPPIGLTTSVVESD